MSSQLSAFKNIDNALCRYYQRLGYSDYRTDNGNGIFLQYVIDEELLDEDLPIEKELGDRCDPNDCAYSWMNNKTEFPIPHYIVIDDEKKETFVFYVLQYCWKHGNPPSDQYIQQILVPKFGGLIYNQSLANIELYVRIPTENGMRTIILYIRNDATIKDLKAAIFDKISTKYKTLKLSSIRISISNLKPLSKDELTLIDYGITKFNSITVSFVAETFKINVRVFSSIYELEVQSNYQILTVKRYFQNKLSIPIKYQKLKYVDCILNDNYTLFQCDIGADAKLKLIIPKELQIFDDLILDKTLSIIHINNQYDMPQNDEIDRISSLFMKTMKPEIDRMSIFQIEKNYQQNLIIYDSLLSLIKNKKEEILFHGTSFANIVKIIHNGFNRDYNKTSYYGKGTYFTKNASFAADYCLEDGDNNYNYKAMLCCKVIIGESTEGNVYMNDDELYNDNGKQYDSLVNDINNPTIFVINRDYHAIPVYIILFNYKDIVDADDFNLNIHSHSLFSNFRLNKPIKPAVFQAFNAFVPSKPFKPNSVPKRNIVHISITKLRLALNLKPLILFPSEPTTINRYKNNIPRHYAKLTGFSDHKLNNKTVKIIKKIKKQKKWQVQILNAGKTKHKKLVASEDNLQPFSYSENLNHQNYFYPIQQRTYYLQKVKKNKKSTKTYHSKKNKYIHHRGYSRRGN